MRSNVSNVMSPKLRRILKKLGADIAIARKKRELTMAMMCERTGVAKQTYQRVEQGDPSVSFGVIAMALFALGEEHRLENLLDVAVDGTGLLLDLSKLPKRVRTDHAS